MEAAITQASNEGFSAEPCLKTAFSVSLESQADVKADLGSGGGEGGASIMC